MVWLAKWIRENVHRRPRAHHHRPHRAGRADREGLQGRQRGHLPHQERRRPDRHAQRHRRPGCSARWSTSSAARRTARTVGDIAGLHRGAEEGAAAGLHGQGRPVRLRGRVPPHPVRRAARGDEGHPARRHVHRLHRHAAAEGRQAEEHRDLRPLHPHLQVRRGGAGRRGARPALRGAGHRPEHHLAGEDRPVVRGQDQGADRSGQGAAQAALGHDAEGALQPVAAGEDRRRHPDGHGDPRPAARAGAATPCWCPAASTRRASSTSCSPRPTSTGKCAIVTSYKPSRRRHQGRGERRGR